MTDTGWKGIEFVRRIRKAGRKRGVDVFFVARRGKGSHGTLYFGERFTIVKDLKRELPTGTVRAMLEQLDLSRKDLT